MIQKLSRPLLRWFRRLERYADKVTGAAGPVFLAIAWALLLFCIITYFDVVFPRVFMTGSWFRLVFGLSFSVYMIYSFLFHYVMAISTDPGLPSRRASSSRKSNSSSSRSSSNSSRAWNRLFLVTNSSNTFLSPNSGASTPVDAESPLKHKQSGGDLSARSRRMLERSCRKCPRGPDGREPFKPERTHHCRVCGRCQLKYDHHCPWIHNCVGLRNERYFVLFMMYLASSATLAGIWSFTPFMEALSVRSKWAHHTPRVGIVLLFVLSVAMACALWIMGIWQLLLVTQGQTTVEATDNEYYEKVAKSRGITFQNPYDLGRMQNLQFFFNVAPIGSHPVSILAPIPFPPASNGINWPKRPGWESNVLAFAEELTDEEEFED